LQRGTVDLERAAGHDLNLSTDNDLNAVVFGSLHACELSSGTVVVDRRAPTRFANDRARQIDPDSLGLTIHNLTQTGAGLANSAGATVKAVQRMLDRASAAMTLDVSARESLIADIVVACTHPPPR